jgi:hypothetical protein
LAFPLESDDEIAITGKFQELWVVFKT